MARWVTTEFYGVNSIQFVLVPGFPTLPFHPTQLPGGNPTLQPKRCSQKSGLRRSCGASGTSSMPPIVHAG